MGKIFERISPTKQGKEQNKSKLKSIFKVNSIIYIPEYGVGNVFLKKSLEKKSTDEKSFISKILNKVLNNM